MNATTSGRTRRRPLPPLVRDEVLREAGYMCGNPVCRRVITLEVHHIEWVRDGGGNKETNLLALCPNCHALHTSGRIPQRAIRHWKGMLHALNHAFNKEAMDLLLYLRLPAVRTVWYSGDGLLRFSGLIAAGLVDVTKVASAIGRRSRRVALRYLMNSEEPPLTRSPTTTVRVGLSAKGKELVRAWLAGDEDGFRGATRTSERARPNNRMQRTRPAQATKPRR
jgi:HNH endonuclease